MDRAAKNMDFKVKHWAPYRRRFPGSFPVVSTDRLHAKDHWVRRAFTTVNFSVILSGRGTYTRAGRVWTVEAPMVLIQLPGEPVEYGPPLPATWEELYVVYEAGLVPSLTAAGLLRVDEPVWPIADLAAVRAQVDELASLATTIHPETVVDRIDRICERLILETRLGASTPPAAPSGGIPGVIQRLRRELGAAVDFDALATAHGMSVSTFRRRWQETVGRPPGEYLEQLRMEEASRLLVETRQAVHEVAHAVGFQDELYFSRRFRRARGLPPREYRRRFALSQP